MYGLRALATASASVVSSSYGDRRRSRSAPLREGFDCVRAHHHEMWAIVIRFRGPPPVYFKNEGNWSHWQASCHVSGLSDCSFKREGRACMGWLNSVVVLCMILTNTRPSQRICGNVVSSPSLVASSINQQQHLAHWNSLLICVDFAKAMRRGGHQLLSTVRSGHAAGREMAHPPAALYCSVRARRRQGKEP